MVARHRLMHLVIQRPLAAPQSARWYIRYVWLGPGGVTRDKVVAHGTVDVDGREGRALLIACLHAAIGELESYTE